MTADANAQLRAVLAVVYAATGGELDEVVTVLVGALVRVANASGCFDAILAVAIKGLDDARALAVRHQAASS